MFVHLDIQSASYLPSHQVRHFSTVSTPSLLCPARSTLGVGGGFTSIEGAGRALDKCRIYIHTFTRSTAEPPKYTLRSTKLGSSLVMQCANRERDVHVCCLHNWADNFHMLLKRRPLDSREAKICAALFITYSASLI